MPPLLSPSIESGVQAAVRIHANVFHMTTATDSYEDLRQEYLDRPRRAPAYSDMTWIPGGAFRMGSDVHYSEEAPVHRVIVSGSWMELIGIGFTHGKIAQASGGNPVQGIFGRHTWSISGIAYFLVIVGLVGLLGATIQHRIRVRQLHAMGLPRQFSIAFIVALLVAAVGIFAFMALVLEL
jgi:uncharacterized membrane protein YidH (DUF202 family)